MKLCLLLAACGGGEASDDGNGPEPDPGGFPVKLTGRVVELDSGGLEDITVEASIDRNGDGEISSAERVTSRTDDDGRFSLEIAASQERSVVVAFRSSGYASVFKTVRAKGEGSVDLDVILTRTEPLECDGTRCRTASGDLAIQGLASGLSGSGRAFNPVTERSAFPGDFSDDRGNLLVSGSFSFVELEDESGNPVHELDQDAELEMRVPRDTWPVIVDIEPGTDRIEVPMYAFDEVSGEWTRDGSGFLVDVSGRVVEEDELDAIRSGSFEGVLNARALVGHFSYWNVDWPIESHGCVTGGLLAADGKPARSARISVVGRTYTGDTEQVADEEGVFCGQVMRSEAEGEDVDGDGRTGTEQRVAVVVRHDGKIYDLDEHKVPVEQGTCGGSCLDLGDVELTEDKEIQPKPCELQGRVVDSRGVPLSNVGVVASDPLIDSESLEATCGLDGCDYYVVTDDDGEFSFRALLALGLEITALHTSNEGIVSKTRYGKLVLPVCPTSPVTVMLSEGYDYVRLTVNVDGQRISWLPSDERINHLFVYSAAGEAKWVARGEGALLAPPVEYGVLPSGFEQLLPLGGGTPPRLSSGDTVYVQGESTSPDGFLVLKTGHVELD